MPLSMTTSTFPLGVVSAQLGLFSFCATGHMCAHLICSKCMCRSDREHFYFFFFTCLALEVFFLSNLYVMISVKFLNHPPSPLTLFSCPLSPCFFSSCYIFFSSAHTRHTVPRISPARGGGDISRSLFTSLYESKD